MNLLDEVRRLQKKYASDKKSAAVLDDCMHLFVEYSKFVRSLIDKPKP